MIEEDDYFGTFEVNLAQREQFRAGHLRIDWANRYPMLFDEQDYQQAVNQPTYHFYEWLAAILIYETTGYRSLLGHYQFKSHRRKQELLCQVVHEPVLKMILDSMKDYHVQCPDLFVYSPDLSDYFFCEVKGCTDRIREKQRAFFNKLQRVSTKRVCYFQFKPLRK